MGLIRIRIENHQYTSIGDVIRASLCQFLENPLDPLDDEIESFEEVRRRLRNRIQRLTEKTENIAEKE
jgi:hypothetical protein